MYFEAYRAEHVASVEAALSPEAYEAALTRGRDMDASDVLEFIHTLEQELQATNANPLLRFAPSRESQG